MAFEFRFSSDEGTVTSPKIAELHALWRERRAVRPLPARRDFDPARFHRLLPNIMLVDIEARPFRVRYRLVGTDVVRVSRLDFTGRYLDELDFANPDTVWIDAYRTLVASGMPVYAVVPIALVEGRRSEYEVAIFPLSTGEDRVDGAIALEDYARMRLVLDEQIMPVAFVTDSDRTEAAAAFFQGS